jgi:thiamine-monophosphate kinase
LVVPKPGRTGCTGVRSDAAAAGGVGDTARDAATSSVGPADGGEFQVIAALRARFEAAAGRTAPAGELWIGDDAALVTDSGGAPLLLATDLVVAGVHVDLDLCTLADLGFKAVMVTISDLAAMGAMPDYLLVSVAAPPGTDLDLLASGVAEAATDVGSVVVGGDLSTAPVVMVSVAVAGSMRDGEVTGGGQGIDGGRSTGADRGTSAGLSIGASQFRRSAPGQGKGSGGAAVGGSTPGALTRSGARAGDSLFVTGPLGASAAGLRMLRTGQIAPGNAGENADGPLLRSLARAHRRPVARLAEGHAARLAGATAAIDISDGLAADVRHLADASRVGIALDLVPVAPGASDDEALGGGEDYELVVATGDPDGLVRAFEAGGLRKPIAIGVCTTDPEERMLAGSDLPDIGWRHVFG